MGWLLLLGQLALAQPAPGFEAGSAPVDERGLVVWDGPLDEAAVLLAGFDELNVDVRAGDELVLVSAATLRWEARAVAIAAGAEALGYEVRRKGKRIVAISGDRSGTRDPQRITVVVTDDGKRVGAQAGMPVTLHAPWPYRKVDGRYVVPREHFAWLLDPSQLDDRIDGRSQWVLPPDPLPMLGFEPGQRLTNETGSRIRDPHELDAVLRALLTESELTLVRSTSTASGFETVPIRIDGEPLEVPVWWSTAPTPEQERLRLGITVDTATYQARFPRDLFGPAPDLGGWTRVPPVGEVEGFALTATRQAREWLLLGERTLVIAVDGKPLTEPDDLLALYEGLLRAEAVRWTERVGGEDRTWTWTIDGPPVEGILSLDDIHYRASIEERRAAAGVTVEGTETRFSRALLIDLSGRAHLNRIGTRYRVDGDGLFALLGYEAGASMPELTSDADVEALLHRLATDPVVEHGGRTLRRTDAPLDPMPLPSSFVRTTDELDPSKWGRYVPHRGPDGELDGLRISGVRRGSALDLLGLKNGDVLHRIGTVEVRGIEVIDALLGAVQGAETVEVELTRRGQRLVQQLGE